MIDYIFRRRN